MRSMWWTYGERAVNMWWTCGEHVVNVSWTFLWTCLEHVVNMSWTCCKHVVNMFWTFCEHVVNMAWTCCEHAVSWGKTYPSATETEVRYRGACYAPKNLSPRLILKRCIFIFRKKVFTCSDRKDLQRRFDLIFHNSCYTYFALLLFHPLQVGVHTLRTCVFILFLKEGCLSPSPFREVRPIKKGFLVVRPLRRGGGVYNPLKH